MNRTLFVIVFSAFFCSCSGLVLAEDDIQKVPSCIYCGMDRAKFAHSRMYVAYDDGSTVGTCSIHCLAIDLATHIDKTPESITVGDYTSTDLIDAERAYWVLGGKKPGVMSKQAKWAFAKKEDAEKFIADNGGTLTDFDQAMQASYQDMYSDIKMIRKKRKMRKMKM